jgi:hypothetical protein
VCGKNTHLVDYACVQNILLVCAFIYYEVCDDVVAHVGM